MDVQMTKSPISTEYDIFISYAHQGDSVSREAVTRFVTRLHGQLSSGFLRRIERDLKIFYDKEDIRDFDHWQVRCHRALRSSRFFIACLSKSYLRSDACRWEWEEWCRHELEHGLVGLGAASLWLVRLEDLDAPEDADRLRLWKGDLLQRFHVQFREWQDDKSEAFFESAEQAELGRLTEHVAARLRTLVMDRARQGNLPWPNANFIGREPELAWLRKALTGAPSSTPAGIHGIGGMGKTALALAFAQREEKAFPGGCWLLRCEGRRSLLSVFRTLVLDLGIELTEEEKLDDVAALRRVFGILSSRGPTLFLLDNVDRPALLAPTELGFLEGQAWARLLYTTRLAPVDFERVEALIRPLDLDRLPENQGIELIRRYQPNQTFISPLHEEAARQIINLLDGLTLAVETAAVYLGQSDARLSGPPLAVDIRDYVRTLRDDLQRGGAQSAMSQFREVMATLSPTLGRLDASARTVLQIAALLGPDAIALPWLRTVAGLRHAELATDAETGQSDPWTRLVRSLMGMRLFQSTAEPRVVAMHGILRRVLEAELRDGRDGIQADIIKHVESREKHLRSSGDWVRSKWEVQPFEALARLWGDSDHPQASRLMSQVGMFQHDLGEWSAAETILRRALAREEAKHGADDPNVAVCLHNLARVLISLGRFGEAEPLIQRTLKIDESHFGVDHPTFATDLNSLAQLLMTTNRPAEAEPLLRRALAILAGDPGEEPLEKAQIIGNLAQLLMTAGRYSEAEPLLRQAVVLWERISGGDHPHMAGAWNDLAQLLQATHRHEEAETMMRRALAVDESCFGKNHFAVARDLGNLGGLLHAVGRHGEAEPLLRQALEVSEAGYGTDHPSVAKSLNNLSQLLQATRRYGEAESLLRRALAIDEAYWGPDHPDLARDLNNLGLLLLAANKLQEAEPLLRRALAINEMNFGADHPDVANSLYHLATLLQDHHRPREAEPLLRRALAIDEAKYGTDHLPIASRLNGLANVLISTDRPAEAEPLLRRALGIRAAHGGKDQRDTFRDLINLAMLLGVLNRWEESEPLLREALSISEASGAEESPDVVGALIPLAKLLQATQRYAEAEPLLRRALAIEEAGYGPGHPKTTPILDDLTALLFATNRSEEAEPLLRRVLMIEEARLGPHHPEIATRLNDLAAVLFAARRPGEAEPLMRRALGIDEANHEADHPDIARDLNNLAGLLWSTDRLGEAEPLMRRNVEIYMKFTGVHGRPHTHLQEAVNNYTFLLRTLGNSDVEIRLMIGRIAEPYGISIN